MLVDDSTGTFFPSWVSTLLDGISIVLAPRWPMRTILLRLLKKLLLFSIEFLILFMGLILSLGVAAYLTDDARTRALVFWFTFLACFVLVCALVIWFRAKTQTWTLEADATAWLKCRARRKLHPRRTKYLRTVRYCLLCLPSLCAAFGLFFLPAASHVLYFDRQPIPHYRTTVPMNWLLVKPYSFDDYVWAFFSDRGSSRYGFTPIWFGRSYPSSATFFVRDPQLADEWRRPEAERISGHTTHAAVRTFRLGMISATCFEYEHRYGSNSAWESLCSTQPNGINYNLRAAFLGNRDDMDAFYQVLNSATPVN